MNIFDKDEKLIDLAKNCPDNVRVLALQDRCDCVIVDIKGPNLSKSGTLIGSGNIEEPQTSSMEIESEKSFTEKVVKIAHKLTEPDSTR